MRKLLASACVLLSLSLGVSYGDDGQKPRASAVRNYQDYLPVPKPGQPDTEVVRVGDISHSPVYRTDNARQWCA